MEHVLRLMTEVRYVRSVTTRLQRDKGDDFFYELISWEDFLYRDLKNQMIQTAFYAGNMYGNDRHGVEIVLSTHTGITALTENGVKNFRGAGYRVVAVRIVPEGHTPRDEKRLAEDKNREQSLVPDFTVINSFAPGGLEKAVTELVSLITNLLGS